MLTQKERILNSSRNITLIGGTEYVGGGYDSFGKGIPLVRISRKHSRIKKSKKSYTL